MAQDVVKGDKVLVYSSPDGTAYSVLGAQRGGTLTINMDTIEVTAKNDELAKEFVSGRYTWTVDCDALVVIGDAGVEQFEAVALSGQEVHVKFEVSDGTNTKTYTGKGIVTSYSVTGSMGDVATVSCSIQGTGELTIS
jgi:TP901-1 family phage major tail protein